MGYRGLGFRVLWFGVEGRGLKLDTDAGNAPESLALKSSRGVGTALEQDHTGNICTLGFYRVWDLGFRVNPKP